jgi:hypothetical protein
LKTRKLQNIQEFNRLLFSTVWKILQMVRSEVSPADRQRIGYTRNAAFKTKEKYHPFANGDTGRAGLINSGGEKKGKEIVRTR